MRKSAVSFLGVFICLFGSEEIADMQDISVIFLSCLFGSEVLVPTLFGNEAFLSCLFGSEAFQTIETIETIETIVSKLPIRQ